jgi:hypothetical protein
METFLGSLLRKSQGALKDFLFLGQKDRSLD